jgi:hypothetical protein
MKRFDPYLPVLGVVPHIPHGEAKSAPLRGTHAFLDSMSDVKRSRSGATGRGAWGSSSLRLRRSQFVSFTGRCYQTRSRLRSRP